MPYGPAKPRPTLGHTLGSRESVEPRAFFARVKHLRYDFPAPPFQRDDPRHTLYSPRFHEQIEYFECFKRARWEYYHPDIRLLAGRLIKRLRKQGIPIYVEGVRACSATFLHCQIAYMTPLEADYIKHEAHYVAHTLSLPIKFAATTATLLKPRDVGFRSNETLNYRELAETQRSQHPQD